MSKRSYYAKSNQARMDVDIEINGLEFKVDVFIKVLDEDILSRPEGYKVGYVAQFAAPLLDEYIIDLSLDPRFNQTSKTFFSQHTGLLDANSQSWGLRFVLDYFPSEGLINSIELKGDMSP